MEKRHNLRNQALLSSVTPSEGGGLTIKARLKRWGVMNLNREVYEEGAYDAFIKDYYERGALNMPLTVQHGSRVEDIVGKVLSLEKDTEGMTVTAEVMDGLPMSETVKKLIADGILQGVSDEGFADDFDYTEKDGYTIRRASMLAVSLVTTPAEMIAKVAVKSAIRTKGFSNQGRLRRRKS